MIRVGVSIQRSFVQIGIVYLVEGPLSSMLLRDLSKTMVGVVQEYAVLGFARTLPESGPRLSAAWAGRRFRCLVSSRVDQTRSVSRSKRVHRWRGEDHGTYDSGSSLQAKAPRVDRYLVEKSPPAKVIRSSFLGAKSAGTRSEATQ